MIYAVAERLNTELRNERGFLILFFRVDTLEMSRRRCGDQCGSRSSNKLKRVDTLEMSRRRCGDQCGTSVTSYKKKERETSIPNPEPGAERDEETRSRGKEGEREDRGREDEETNAEQRNGGTAERRNELGTL